ncbi:MAG TPA: hypothetical protein VG106_12585, partial [Vicinamibacterales bacterium]|nr:hypothetical protein [Vicinamibacterales bacterium]
EYIDEFAHGAIDAGADVFFNNGGAHMGVEIYDGKAIVYGLPSFFLQTEAVRHVPSGSMSRYGLAADGTASDFIETRAAWAVRATTAAGGLSAGWKLMAGGSAVHTFSFDQRARLQEIRVHPIEPLGGTNLNPDERADDAVRIPRFRMSMPLMAEPDSALAERVLEQTVESSRRFGTSVEITDDVAIIRV